MKFAQSVKALALAGAVLFAPSLASAATLTYQNAGNIFGSNGSASVHILSPRDIWTHAGGFALNGDISGDSAAESFTAWCLDIYAYISNGQNYNITTSPFSVAPLTQARIDNIRALFNTGLSGLNLGIGSNSAGFQLALWGARLRKSRQSLECRCREVPCVKQHRCNQHGEPSAGRFGWPDHRQLQPDILGIRRPPQPKSGHRQPNSG